VYSQVPSQSRLSLQIQLEGHRIDTVSVLDIDKAWERLDTGDQKKAEAVSGPALAKTQVEAYVEYLSTLLPLLKEGEYSLTVDKPDGKGVQILVKKKDKPDVRLIFDPETHFLSKVSFRVFNPEKNKEVLQEETRSDYRVVDLTGADERVIAAAKLP